MHQPLKPSYFLSDRALVRVCCVPRCALGLGGEARVSTALLWIVQVQVQANNGLKQLSEACVLTPVCV